MKRRTFIAGLGAAAVLPIMWVVTSSSVLLAPAPARGQADGWQLYRREDLGFEVEMPGVPKIEVEEGEKDDSVAKSVDSVVELEDINFSIRYEEWRGRPTVDQEIAAQRFGARTLGIKVISETRFTLNGAPGVEISTDAIDGTPLRFNYRVVFGENRRFFLGAVGAPADNPSVRRFFDSFKLLSTGR
jgi:hypothetical protein